MLPGIFRQAGRLWIKCSIAGCDVSGLSSIQGCVEDFCHSPPGPCVNRM